MSRAEDPALMLSVHGVGSSPAIGPDGTIYVGAMDHNLYAIHSTSMGLADSSWPMRGHDTMHTGRQDESTPPSPSLYTLTTSSTHGAISKSPNKSE